jgi:hypothetical protein
MDRNRKAKDSQGTHSQLLTPPDGTQKLGLRTMHKRVEEQADERRARDIEGRRSPRTETDQEAALQGKSRPETRG